MPRVIESMTRCVWKWGFRTFVIRVWRQEESLSLWDNDDIKQLIEWKCRTADDIDPTTRPPHEQLIEDIARLPRINAIEIVDENGNGVVLYTEWP